MQFLPLGFFSKFSLWRIILFLLKMTDFLRRRKLELKKLYVYSKKSISVSARTLKCPAWLSSGNFSSNLSLPNVICTHRRPNCIKNFAKLFQPLSTQSFYKQILFDLIPKSTQNYGTKIISDSISRQSGKKKLQQETVPYFLQSSQNLTNDCLLIQLNFPVFT